MRLSSVLCTIALFWFHDEIPYIQCISYARPYYRMTNNESSLYQNMRHRQDHVSSLSSSYGYQTKYISIESCRYMNITLCQKEDEYYGRMKEQIRINQRRRLSSTKEGTNVRVLVLLVQFTDHNTTDHILPTIEQINEIFNGNGGTDINPVGSIRNYFYVNSLTKYHGTFSVRFDSSCRMAFIILVMKFLLIQKKKNIHFLFLSNLIIPFLFCLFIYLFLLLLVSFWNFMMFFYIYI